MLRRLAPVLALLALVAPAGAGEFFTLEGHGGPVRSIAVLPDGSAILTASFDTSLGYWRDGAPVWLEGHEASANAVRFVDANHAVSGGDDFAVRLWNLADGSGTLLGRHAGKVVALALSPDRRTVATASWDGTVGLWPLDGGPRTTLEPGGGAVNDVAFSRDGRQLFVATADGTLTVWQLGPDPRPRTLVRNAFGINRLQLGPEDRWLAFGAVDGVTHVIDAATGDLLADFTFGRRPILAIALDPGGRTLAIGDGKGYISLFNTSDWSIAADFRASARGPIWALAFSADGENILAGGLDEAVFAFPVDGTREPPKMGAALRARIEGSVAASNGELQFRRRCSICHTLEPDGRRRAGPSLFGLFGRRAGSLDGYSYSETLQHSTITWTEDTVDQLFDLGPDVYIAGTKMPVQRIAEAEDRADLIAFLRFATAGDAAAPE